MIQYSLPVTVSLIESLIQRDQRFFNQWLQQTDSSERQKKTPPQAMLTGLDELEKGLLEAMNRARTDSVYYRSLHSKLVALERFKGEVKQRVTQNSGPTLLND